MLKRHRTKDQSLDAIAKLLEGYELPSFSSVVTAALDELADPDVSLGKVARVLHNDPGLSVHFLRLANSASLGLRSSVDSLDRAVAMLGRNQVESVLIGQAVSQSVKPRSPIVNQSRFWTTAATRAVVAAELAGALDPSHRSEHFTAALLQEMALPVLADHVRGYEAVLQGWYDGTVTDLVSTEQETYGWHHGMVGAYLCQTWQFPENLVAAVKSHHDDIRTPAQMVAGWHETDEERGPRLLAERAAAAGLSEDEIADRLEKGLAGAHEVASLFVH